MEKNEIKFKDLSIWLKIAVVCSYVVGGVFILSFVIGFIQGILEATL